MIFFNSVRRYAESAKKRSMLMHDRVVEPNEELGYWVEYVIRHRGAAHFRSAALDLSWYQLYSLDVICCVVGVFGGLVYLLAKMCRRKANVERKNKKQKRT